jgi:hypothetical protein
MHSFLVASLALGLGRTGRTSVAKLVRRSEMPWRLALEDVEAMSLSQARGVEALRSIALPLAVIGACATLTTSNFCCVAAPPSCKPKTLGVLDTVVAHLEPAPNKPIELVDSVTVFSCPETRVFQCCNSRAYPYTATASRIAHTCVWMLFDDKFTGLTRNSYTSRISRAQFTELQETFGGLLGLRFSEPDDHTSF